MEEWEVDEDEPLDICQADASLEIKLTGHSVLYRSLKSHPYVAVNKIDLEEEIWKWKHRFYEFPFDFPLFHVLASLMERFVNNSPLVSGLKKVKVPHNLLFIFSSCVTITHFGCLHGPSGENLCLYHFPTVLTWITWTKNTLLWFR